MRLTGFGLWRHRARAYHPGMGRFLQADPIGYGDGMNMYAYVGGDPVNFADPTGLKRISAETKPIDMIVVHAVGPENAPISVSVLSGHAPPHASCGATCWVYNRSSGRRAGGAWQSSFWRANASLPSGGETGSGGGRRNRNSTEQCNAPLTVDERRNAAAGNRQEFWQSRRDQGDPVAQTALDIFNNTGLGAVANRRLHNAISPPMMGAGTRFIPFIPPRTTASVNDIGVALMQGHVRTIDRFPSQSGILSPRDIADYHHGIFADFNLPANTFGGTPVTGALWEAGLTQALWYDGCEG